MFYTYLYLREDGTPYYAGKGKGRRAFKKHSHISVPSDRERILLQDMDSESEAIEAEKFFISYYGREDLGTGCLLNMTCGGDGVGQNNKSGLGHRRNGTGIFLPGAAAKGGYTQGKINAENGQMSRAGSVGGRSKSKKKLAASIANAVRARAVRLERIANEKVLQ